jgi:Carboxypeptidase regulatory-like domain
MFQNRRFTFCFFLTPLPLVFIVLSRKIQRTDRSVRTSPKDQTEILKFYGATMRRIVIVFVACISLAVAAIAQETRATLTGRVTDPTGAIVPNANINIINTDTGTQTAVKSNQDGDYTVPFLLPGTYEVSAEITGFKTYVHTGLVLQTEQTVTENIVLQVGTVDQSVTVSGGTPLIDTANADVGESLTSEATMDLPSNGRSPLGFAHLEFGAVAKGKHSMSQVTPFGNSTADDFSMGGGASSSNELLLNGVPNMEDSSRTAGFSPQLDAVDAVHVDEFAANAALGDTTGGFINITTKGGTNQLHGSASEYYSGSRPFEALPYFTNPGTTITSTHFNQFGGTVGGPIVIPHVIHGRDKLFFFYAFEGYIGNSPSTVITSVPTAAERQGDFSATVGYNTSDQLYNPYTPSSYATTQVAGEWIRQAIPNNCLGPAASSYSASDCPSNAGLTLDPVAQAYMKLVPMPNYTGSSAKADGEDNFYAYDPTSNNYKSNQGRFDYDITESDKLYLEAHRSQYNQTSANIFNNALSGSYSTVILWGGQADNVKNFNASTNLETRLGFSRYETFGGPNSLGESPTSLGFAGYLAQNSTAPALPYLQFTDGANVPSLSGNPATTEYYDDIQLFSSFNKTMGRHSLKIGLDIRSNKYSSVAPGAANGNFMFNFSKTSLVSESPNYAADEIEQPFGSTLALLMLGLPSSGSFNIAQQYQYDNWYTAYFAQDDWKAMHNLTLSMGVRVEHETPLVESNNKMVQNWYPFLTNATSSTSASNFSSQASADNTTIIGKTCNGAPCVNYLPAAASFSASGGTIYASTGNRSPYYPAAVYLSPRLGFSYAPDFFHGTMAIRGGVGIYVNPFNDYQGDAGQAYGFTQSTNLNMTNSSCNSGYTPITSMDNPFPTSPVTNASGTCANSVNPIQPPLANIEGANAQLGSSMSWVAPVKIPYSEKFDLDVQKQFINSWLVELGAIHVLALHNSYTNQVYEAPFLPYLSNTPNADSAQALSTSDAMAVKVTNPFLGTMPSFTNPRTGTVVANTTGLNTGSTIAQSSLLQAYPEYSSIAETLIPGSTLKFNAVMFRVDKRMSYGLEFAFNYIWSRQLGTTTQLNAGGPLWYGETSSDFPQHVSVLAIYQLPFGRGRMFGNSINRALDEAIGGWEVTGIYQYLSGTPIGWGNANYSGNFTGFDNHPHQTHGPSFNTAGFDTVSADQPGSWNFRTFPADLLRSDPTNNFDFSILKDFTIWERVRVQPRVDCFNCLNHAQMSSANVTPTSASFADVTSQLNINRSLQGGIHILF